MPSGTTIALELVRVDLTAEDAALFWEFQKHREAFAVMLKAGVFHMKQGTATLSYSPEGVLTGIETTRVAFRR